MSVTHTIYFLIVYYNLCDDVDVNGPQIIVWAALPVQPLRYKIIAELSNIYTLTFDCLINFS